MILNFWSLVGTLIPANRLAIRSLVDGDANQQLSSVVKHMLQM